jgi:hypothetical protein
MKNDRKEVENNWKEVENVQKGILVVKKHGALEEALSEGKNFLKLKKIPGS